MFVVLFGILLSVPGFAQHKFGPVSTGTAQSGRAAVVPGETSLLNPAGIVHLRGHYLTLSGMQANPPSGPKTEVYDVSISENEVDSVVPASLYYSQGNYSDPDRGDIAEKYFHLAFSNMLFDRFSVGFGLHHLEQRLLEQGYNQNNLDIGTLLIPFDDFGVGIVFYNFISTDAVVPETLHEKSYQALAMNYVFQEFLRARLDFVAKGSQLGTSFGIESFINKFIAVRLGYGQNVEDRSVVVGAGLGFKGPRFSLDYGYQNLAGLQKGATHMVDIVLSF